MAAVSIIDSILACMSVKRTPCGHWGVLWQVDNGAARPVITDSLDAEGKVKMVALLYGTQNEAVDAADALAHMIDQGFMLPSVTEHGVLVELSNPVENRPLC